MSAQTMQAVQVHQYGGPAQLQLETVPRPEPTAGMVLIKVHAAGVLPMEWKVRQGLFKNFQPAKFPYTPGSAMAGVIEAVGSEVTAFEVGQAVFGRTNYGAYAEYTIGTVDTLALKPAELSFAEAATISGGATVAWPALFENMALQAGQRILIHGAAGGVGLFAVQFASQHGAQVSGTASTNNLDFVRALGAEQVIDYTTTRFEDAIQAVDAVLDTVGGETLQRSMPIIKPGGILVSLLENPDQTAAQRYGIRAMKNAAALPFPSTKLLDTIAQLIARGRVRTNIAHSFPLREANLAHTLSATGHGRGRIVLDIMHD